MNDCVVVRGKLSCLDSGFEFHTILLSVNGSYFRMHDLGPQHRHMPQGVNER
jgi:hypothetical protein